MQGVPNAFNFCLQIAEQHIETKCVKGNSSRPLQNKPTRKNPIKKKRLKLVLNFCILKMKLIVERKKTSSFVDKNPFCRASDTHVLMYPIFDVYELGPNLPGTQARRGKLEKTGATASTQVASLTVAYLPVASEIYSISLFIYFFETLNIIFSIFLFTHFHIYFPQGRVMGAGALGSSKRLTVFSNK